MVLSQVRQTITRRALLKSGDHVLVAVSGGSDSVALMMVLAQLQKSLGIHVSVASVDHGLRAESREEVLAVGVLAGRLGLLFSPVQLSLTVGSNIQAQAREARYAALWKVARAHGSKKIALGHTRDDQAETVLGRLLRGSGVRGLRGIQPLRGDGLVRPLIALSRADLQTYLRKKGIAWADDPSNQDPAYERVRLRTILGQLKKEDPALSTHLADLADDAADIEEALSDWAGRVGLALSALAAAPRAVRRVVLRDAVEKKVGRSPRRAHLEALDLLATTGRGEVWLGDGWRARASSEEVIFERGDWRRESK